MWRDFSYARTLFGRKAFSARSLRIPWARQAYKPEVQVLKLVPNEPAAQPTRAILYRSAASLAYQV
jgi:hypothetical protein